jgi:hypothetical protein
MAQQASIPVFVVLSRLHQLELHSIYTIHTVDEQNQDKDKCDLHPVLYLCDDWVFREEAGFPQLSAANETTRKQDVSYVNILLLTVKGNGRMSSMKRPISAISSTNT